MGDKVDLINSNTKNSEMELEEGFEMNPSLSSLNFDNTSSIKEIKPLISVSSLSNKSDFNEPALESSIIDNGDIINNNDNNDNELDLNIITVAKGNILGEDDNEANKDIDTDRTSQIDTGRTSEYDRDSFLTFLTSMGFVYDKEREESSQLLNEMCNHIDYSVNKETYERSEIVIILNELCSDVDEQMGGESRRKFECNCIIQEMISFIHNTNNRIIIEERLDQFDYFDENISVLTGIEGDSLSITDTAASPDIDMTSPNPNLNPNLNLTNLTLNTGITPTTITNRPSSPNIDAHVHEGGSPSFNARITTATVVTTDTKTKTKITLIPSTNSNNYNAFTNTNTNEYTWSDMKEVGRLLYEIVDRIGHDGGDTLTLTGLESIHTLSQEDQERVSRDPIFTYCRNNNTYDLSLRLTIDPDSRDLQDIGKCTPLTLACMYKSYDVAVYLIQIGANVYHRDNAGYIPFDYIRNEEEKKRLKYEYWLTTDEAHNHFQSIEDKWQLQLCELQKKDIPNIINASMNGDLEAIKDYFNSNNNMIHLRDHMGNTPLLAASAMQQYHVAEFLLEKGADINARTNNGQSVLSLARGPSKRTELAFLAEAATIEYKAHEHAKSLFTVGYDHALARMEIEAVWQVKKIEAEKLARFNAMVARLQHSNAVDTVDNVIISSTEASFIHFMVEEENRLAVLQTKITNAINDEYKVVDSERLEYLRWKIMIENRAKESAKVRRQQDKEIEEESYASTTSFLRRTFAAKTVEEERGMAHAGNRVRQLYAKYEEKKEMKLRAKDLKLKPRKAELAARMSQSLRMSMK